MRRCTIITTLIILTNNNAAAATITINHKNENKNK